MAAASAEGAAKLVGVYDFTHPHGTFQVHLRPDGKFFAPQYQARATWVVTESGHLSIDWGKYGQYELDLTDAATRAFKGSFVGQPDNWRTMKLRRPFSAAEMGVLDSEWELEHPSGKFNVEFRADAYNHFICNDFPAHSHWRLDNDESSTPTMYINWGKYGEYELVVSADGQTMQGSAKGQPDNWRRCRRLRALGAVEEAHVHDH